MAHVVFHPLTSAIQNPSCMKSLLFLAPKFFRIVLGMISMMALIAPATAQIHRLNSDELTLFKRLAANSQQQREAMALDPILCMVARKHATDMAKRNYFGHTNPDGQGPNYLVRRAGYVLPSYYDSSRSGNNIESIGKSTGSPRSVISLWLRSSGHRPHIVGELDFYQQQSAIGVGVYRSPTPPHYRYYVFLSAPPKVSLSPRLVTLKSPSGATLASTRPTANDLARFTGIAAE